MINNLMLWRVVTLVGLFGLIALIVIWNGWLTPAQYINRGIEIAIFTIPLLFFVRGIIHADREKHMAIALLSFVYFCLGIWFVFSPDERIYGYLMTGLSLCLYLGGFFYVRTLDKLEGKMISK
ncbi:MAG TPA: DUF2069 domain-containing protein [Leucothrix mucor]|nr:DUF2069 domain-containing protein [Leucothrix mucor]